MHATKKAHLYFRIAETGAHKDKITCRGLRKSLWKKETHFTFLPILSNPPNINNNLEVLYSKSKYLKPYVQLISAQMTWQTKRRASQVEVITQINTTVSLHL